MKRSLPSKAINSIYYLIEFLLNQLNYKTNHVMFHIFFFSVLPPVSTGMRVLAVFLFCLRLVATIEVVICDCTNSRNLGFIKTKEECNLEELPESEPAYY